MDLKVCPDGTPAPIPAGECCPSLKACASLIVSSRSGLLGSLGSNANLLQTLTSATHGTDLGTVLSILNLLNNIQQFTNDVHQIPVLINQTLAGLVSGAGQAGQIIVDQLIGSITNQQNNGRDLLGSLGQNVNLLSSIGHLLPQGTSIATVISILNLLNNINALSNDIHQIPVLLNQTLLTLVGGAGEAGQVIVNQLLGLVGVQTQGRDLLGSLGQNVNLLSSIGHLLPQGTSIATVISILNLLNNINALSNDIHQIPVLLNQTLSTLVGGAGEAGQVIVNQLLGLVGVQTQGRDLLGSLGQNVNLLSSIGHLLPQGTSITTVISLLNLLNNVNALNNDLHQIPVVLQETLSNLLNGVQNLLPPTLQPVQGA